MIWEKNSEIWDQIEVKTFFFIFFRDQYDFGKNKGNMRSKPPFFWRTPIFGNPCLEPLTLYIRHCVQPYFNLGQILNQAKVAGPQKACHAESRCNFLIFVSKIKCSVKKKKKRWTKTLSMAFCQNTKISRHTSIPITAHSLGNPGLQHQMLCSSLKTKNNCIALDQYLCSRSLRILLIAKVVDGFFLNPNYRSLSRLYLIK